MRSIAALAACAVAIQPVAALAQDVPGSVRDLVGVRASAGESTLQTRGFTYIDGGTKNDRKIGYWWNPNTRECIKVATYDGEFEQLSTTSHSDCNQRSGGTDGVVAATVGAAAILGVIALTHRSHDHDNDQHHADATNEVHYEQGYRDGLYSQPYHNYERSDSYSSGYENGVRARGNETAYRSGNHDGAGYSDHVSLRDLEGRDRDYAYYQLASRGFVVRDNKRTDEGRFATYWREASRQCVIVASRDGSVFSIEHTSDRTCRN